MESTPDPLDHMIPSHLGSQISLSSFDSTLLLLVQQTVNIQIVIAWWEDISSPIFKVHVYAVYATVIYE